jgi:cytoskeleton protein RodZ
MNQLSSLQAEQLKEIGGYLRQLREERPLSVEDIAAITRIRVPMLEALESGNLDRLPELIYVKGFIRRYGEALGIDGKSLSDRLSPSAQQLVQEAATPKKTAPKVTPPAVPVEKNATKPSQSLPKAATPAQPARAILKAANPAQPAKKSVFGLSLWLGLLAGVSCGLGGLGYLFLSRPPANNQAIEPAPEISPSPVVLPSPVASPVPARATPLSVTVSIDNPAWLRVRADGKTLQEGILKPGTKQTWTANKTLNIRTGNAGGVQFSLNDRPAEVMGPLGQIADRTFTAEPANR